MKSMPEFGSGAVERNRTSTGIAHSDLNAARLPIPPRPLKMIRAFPGYGEVDALQQGMPLKGRAD